MALTERTFISQFDIQSTGAIHVRKTTEILRDGVSVSQSYWRCVLTPNDPNAASVLDEPYYLTLAQQAWAALPTGD
jgi:hypothetical protein